MIAAAFDDGGIVVPLLIGLFVAAVIAWLCVARSNRHERVALTRWQQHGRQVAAEQQLLALALRARTPQRWAPPDPGSLIDTWPPPVDVTAAAAGQRELAWARAMQHESDRRAVARAIRRRDPLGY